MTRLVVAAVLMAGLTPLGLMPGQWGSLDAPQARPKQQVAYVAEAQTVAAGKHAVLELRFRVADGYHVNSHRPKSELQIATTLELTAAEGVAAAAAEYPAGKEFAFAFDPNEKLDVYTDGFTVRVPVVAAAGAHELKGTLHYQACDHAACFPPKALPVAVMFTAK